MKFCTEKCIHIIAWFTIISALALMGLFIFWLVYPYQTTDFINSPFPVQNKKVKVGGYVFYRVDYCKYTDLIPEVSKTFIDGVLYTIPPAVGAKNPMGCHTNLVQTYVPKALVPGKYVIQINYKYHVNPLREIEIKTETEPFEVVEKEDI